MCEVIFMLMHINKDTQLAVHCFVEARAKWFPSILPTNGTPHFYFSFWLNVCYIQDQLSPIATTLMHLHCDKKNSLWNNMFQNIDEL